MECVISIIVIYSELITPSVQRVISIIATYSALIPVVVGILAFRKAKTAYRLFILFLFYGFLTDSATWRLYDAGNYAGYRSLTYIYGMVESLFFTWFIQRTGTVLFVNIGIKICYFLFPLMWFFMHIDVSTFTWIKDTYNAQFVTIYQITIATFAAYSIFYLLKEKRFFYTPLFWFLSGIFAYCFLTFIPCAFLFTTQYKDVWYLHNLVNVMTMLLYTWGYVLIVGKNETPVVS